MKIVGLIIPDVHEQVEKLKKILALKKYQGVWVVFLGDFMDTFDGLTWKTHEMVRWMAGEVGNPNYTFVWGNHDMHYAFPVDGVMCSGFDPKKLDIVRKHLTDEQHWKKFKLLHWIGERSDDGNQENPKATEFLISHGGIHPSLLHPFYGFDRKALLTMEEEAMWKLRYCQQVTSFVAAGRGRGGPARVGGVDWLDWSTEFIAIPGLNQIVGHSFGPDVREKKLKHSTIRGAYESVNYCVDTHLKHVVEIREDGSIKIVKVVV